MKILCISTGGTICSVKKEDGGLCPGGEKQIDGIIDSIDGVEIETKELMSLDSTNIGYDEWLLIEEEIKAHRNAYDGFLVVMGTDTICYAGAALARLLGDMKTPVVLTGSMIPAGREDSDAEDNLKGAVKSLSRLINAEKLGLPKKATVFIYFAGRIMEAAWTTKVDSTNKDAILEIPHNKEDDVRIDEIASRFHNELRDKKKVKAGIIRLYPNFDAELFRAYSGYDTVILETFGAGGVPDREGASLVLAIKELSDAGVKVFAKSQCLFSGAFLSRYEVGRSLLSAGAIDLGQITTENAYASLICSGM